ncbi:MAG: cbb3-type cytochrome c oxidase subunit II [Verrucomicrobiota bacterium]
MNRLTTFVIGLAITFGVPWFLLIAMPHGAMQDLAEVRYDEDSDGEPEHSVFPPGRSGRVADGHTVYARNGCAYCHTQMVRPTYLGNDRWRDGWGGRGENWEGEEAAIPVRETVPHDYLGEPFAFLGIQRNGPDLSNVGWRIQDKKWHHLHLYNPRAVREWSNMPSFRHLYKVQEIVGQPSENALALEGDAAPEIGYEVVPTGEAEALVSYLLSLRKDYQLPRAIAGPAQQAVAAGGATTAPAP